MDPRWVLFLVREAEFSDRTPRGAASLLLDEAERALPKWNAQGGSVAQATSPYTNDEWRAEVERCVARARDLTVEKGFVDVPAGELPTVVDSPLHSRGLPNEPSYTSRPLHPTLRGQLWVTGWDTSKSRAASWSPTTAQVCVMAETYPGRHVHGLLSRRDGTMIRRMYESQALAEGWRACCHRWAGGVLPNAAYDQAHADGFRFSTAWAAAVEICYISGTLREDEAIELLTGATSEDEDQARARLSASIAQPFFTSSIVLGEIDLVALREEMHARLGPKFDLKQFHTRLLGYGRAPIALIREEMLRDAR